MMAYITYFNFFVGYNLKYTVGTLFSHFDATTQALSSYYYRFMFLCQAKYCCISITNVSARQYFLFSLLTWHLAHKLYVLMSSNAVFFLFHLIHTSKINKYIKRFIGMVAHSQGGSSSNTSDRISEVPGKQSSRSKGVNQQIDPH